MITHPDHFLRLFFTEEDRRSHARCVSLEASSSGSRETARWNDARWSWACVVIGALEMSGKLTPQAREVCRQVYLNLSQSHVAIMRGRRAVRVGQGESAPAGVGLSAEDMQSYTRWSDVAKAAGLSSSRAARGLWSRTRRAVEEELRERQNLTHSAPWRL